jgi:general secretion pathway protein G
MRMGQLLLGAFIVSFCGVVLAREERAAAVRATRTRLALLDQALLAYRADHDRGCPKSIQELVTADYLKDIPLDAWGHPLQLRCPGRRDAAGYDIFSDGPDGVNGGFDRVE